MYYMPKYLTYPFVLHLQQITNPTAVATKTTKLVPATIPTKITPLWSLDPYVGAGFGFFSPGENK